MVYKDLNYLFQSFEKADDFSCFGKVLPVTDERNGWYRWSELGTYKDDVKYSVSLHGGLYYFRKTIKAKRVFYTAKGLGDQYWDLPFNSIFKKIADEPIMALSMALNNCKPIPYDLSSLCFLWEHEKNAKLNMAKRTAIISEKNYNWHPAIVHFGTNKTKLPLYQKETEILNLILSKNRYNRLQIVCIQLKYNFIKNYKRTRHILHKMNI